MPFALRPGTMITGYEVVRAIGAGGFGITYEGFNPVTERRVAIKEFFPRGIASRDDATRIAYSKQDDEIVAWALKRFAESTNRLAKLKHPHIIEVLNYVADNGTGYMVMEHVDGTTLEDWLRALTMPPQLAELGPIFDPIFDALEYVHSKGLIHRDIAPDNIMIRNDDKRPVLIDFGALKIIEEHTRAHGTAPKSFGVMKLNYSPPEQAEDGAVPDPRVDVYALAATIYRSLAGRPPMDADKRKTDLALRGVDSYESLATAALVPLPAEFAAAIDAAMSLRPAGRPATIAEFRKSLALREADGLATVAQRPDERTRVERPVDTTRVVPAEPAALAAAAASPVPLYDAGQPMASGAYAPPGGTTPTVQRSGISWFGISAIGFVIVAALAVLLHRPVLNLVESMTGMKIISSDEDTPPVVQPQQKQAQKQTPPQKQTPAQKQTQKQTQEPQQKQQPAQQRQLPEPTGAARSALDRGNENQNLGNHTAAIDAYAETIRLDPNAVNAWVGRGLSYYRLRNFDRAVADYTEAIRLEPNTKRASIPYLNRGIIHRERNDFELALVDINNAIRLDPAFPSPYNTRANIYYDRKDYDRAIPDYSEAIRLNPSYAVAYTNRGNAHYAKREYQRAIDDYSTAIRLNAKDVAAFVGRGNCYDELKDADRAIADYSQAIRIDSGYALAYFNRARVYLDRRDFISALSDYSDAVRLDPKRATAHQGRGLANEGLNRRNEAIRDFREALKLDSSLQRSRDALRRLNAEP